MKTTHLCFSFTLMATGAVLLLAGLPASAQYQAEVLKSFGNASQSGAGPMARLIKDRDGIVYGTTQRGGRTDWGTVFAFKESNGQLQVLHQFDMATDGGEPHAGVIEGPDGALYGTTSAGGNFGIGTLFRMEKDGTRFAVLHHFGDEFDGDWPEGELWAGSDDRLYGTTRAGGAGTGLGTVFRISPDGRGYVILHTFNSATEGGEPYAGLVEHTDGYLYGVTSTGGSAGSGTVFRLRMDGAGFEVLHDFASSDGTQAFGDLCLASDGRLYGTASSGGKGYGTIFGLDRSGKNFAVLHAFPNEKDAGANPQAGLVEGADGRLYGTTEFGGRANSGTLFALTKNGSSFTSLHDFDAWGSDGMLPVVTLLADGRGLVYGTCPESWGGAGTLFRLQEDGSRFSTLWTFEPAGGDCMEPSAGLIEGGDGMLYGIAYSGGILNKGGVFRLGKDASGYEILYSFGTTASDGEGPQAMLLEDSDGVLYGTTTQPSSGPAVFRLNKNGSGYKVLHRFAASGAEGKQLAAELIEGSDGLLYGTASSGGTSNWGTVFRLGKGGDNFTVLHHFTGGASDGAVPTAGLVEDLNGVLYGCTVFGSALGVGAGTVFKMDRNGANFQVLHEFSGPDGQYPKSTLLLVRSTLFGTTEWGGSSSQGTVFRIKTDGTGFSVLKHFGFGNGMPSRGRLTQGPDGALYGTTLSGGRFGYGSIFKIKMDGTGFGVLHSFNAGNFPHGPEADLLLGSDGQWYGATTGGGEMNLGTVYRLSVVSPRLTGVTRDTNGCHLTFQGLPGFQYELQASENLTPANWETIDEFSPESDGSKTLDDGSAPQVTNQFYRVWWGIE